MQYSYQSLCVIRGISSAPLSTNSLFSLVIGGAELGPRRQPLLRHVQGPTVRSDKMSVLGLGISAGKLPRPSKVRGIRTENNGGVY
jgi:hypothetical protein